MRARRPLAVAAVLALAVFPLAAWAKGGALVRGKLTFYEGSKNDWTELVAEGTWRAPMSPVWSEQTAWVSEKAQVFAGFEGSLRWRHHSLSKEELHLSKPPTKEELEYARRTQKSLDSSWGHQVTIDEDASDLGAMFDDHGRGASLGLLRFDADNGHLAIEPPRISALNNAVDRKDMVITAINLLGEKMDLPSSPSQSLWRGFFFDHGTWAPKGSSAQGKWIAPKNPDADPDDEPRETWVQWNFALREQDLEVLVFLDALPAPDGTGVDAWGDWLPRGGRDEQTAGAYLGVRAQVFGKDGTPTQRRAKFTFTLQNVSRQPGTCLNAPLAAAGARPAADLAFETRHNKHLAVFDEGQRAVSAEVGVSDRAVLSSFDWGAWGTVEVTAELEDGTALPKGRLKEKGSLTTIPLPWREGGSKIAAAWRQQQGFGGEADDWDGELVPRLNGLPGDGLTLYEEYRGLMVRGAHVRLEPEQKRRVRKLVVSNGAGAIGTSGLSILAAATKGPGDAASLRLVDVAGDELRREGDGSRSVNFNFDGETPRGGLQHGLAVVATAMKGSQTGLCVPISGVTLPHSPREVAEVDVSNAPIPAEQRAEATVTVAHELAHGLGALHHGDGDALYVPSRFTSSMNVRLFDIHGEAIALPWPSDGAMKRQEMAGAPHGQQSGDVGCLMHYSHYFSFAVHKGAGTTDYYSVPSISPGTKLCTSPAGTGYNQATPQRPALFGDAQAGRGNCLGTLRLKDW